MELKKKPEADLNKKSGLFFNIGLIVSLLICITAFEWRFYDYNSGVNLGALTEEFEEMEEIPPTEQLPPPPPQLQQPEIVEVPDEEEIEQDLNVNLDVEITQETVVAVVIPTSPVIHEEEVEEVFTIVEDQPTPNGGMKAFYEYVGKNMKYPEQAKRMGIEGRVFVQFVVDKDGALTDIQVLKGIGAGCDEEAIRVIKTAPKWKPGKQRGRPVKVKMSLPIVFKLN